VEGEKPAESESGRIKKKKQWENIKDDQTNLNR
jgi:hypothetical protein